MKKKIDVTNHRSETNSDLTNLNKRNPSEIKSSSLPNSFLVSTDSTSRAFDLSKVTKSNPKGLTFFPVTTISGFLGPSILDIFIKMEQFHMSKSSLTNSSENS